MAVVRTVGCVSALWRYPVKSMLGERCEMLLLQARGAEGDRQFALRDASGKFGSGKNTRRFRRIDGLFRFSARYRGEVVEIVLPNGRLLRSDAAMVDEVLSDALNMPVQLTREADVSHFDAAPVHLLSTASLAWLRNALPHLELDERRFRPNLVVEVPGMVMVEQEWLGQQLCIGEQVRLRISAATERCGMVASAQEGLSPAPEVLGHIAREAQCRFGVYAEVVVPGVVRPGDAVTIDSR